MNSDLAYHNAMAGEMKLSLSKSVNKLEQYIEEAGYKGYDPYDGLTAPLFKYAWMKNKKLRFYCQQLIKRSPVNLRPLLNIRRGMDPVTLGLCIQGYGNRRLAEDKSKDIYNKKAISLISRLDTLIPNGYHGACWGYYFDWEARYASIPAYQPTVVATGIITNALYTIYKTAGIEKAAQLVTSAANFILNDLNSMEETDSTLCFSYSPFDHQKVFNASMKGVKLLSQAYDLTGNELYREKAGKAAWFVINRQRSDGSWIYSENKGGDWVDNYHTGYILDALDEYIRLCNDRKAEEYLEKGLQFYLRHFIRIDGMPLLYIGKQYPVDCTAAAQCILTLLRFDQRQQAASVAVWMIKNMQAADGSFYYRKYKMHTVKTPFMRWSDAWMYAALTSLEKTQ